jgi:hypothetical protein
MRKLIVLLISTGVLGGLFVQGAGFASADSAPFTGKIVAPGVVNPPFTGTFRLLPRTTVKHNFGGHKTSYKIGRVERGKKLTFEFTLAVPAAVRFSTVGRMLSNTSPTIRNLGTTQFPAGPGKFSFSTKNLRPGKYELYADVSGYSTNLVEFLVSKKR